MSDYSSKNATLQDIDSAVGQTWEPVAGHHEIPKLQLRISYAVCISKQPPQNFKGKAILICLKTFVMADLPDS